MSSEGGTAGRASVKLAVLGDPLAYTRSPDLHRAGAAALGVECESTAIRTPIDALPATLERLAAEGYTGCNLTMPLKGAALTCMRSVSPAALAARSVNTVAFHPDGPEGDSTDGVGFVDLLHSLGRDPAAARVVLIGSGGAARSLAWQLGRDSTHGIHVLSRRAPMADPEWKAMPPSHGWSAWGSPEGGMALLGADVVVNCTPLPAPVEVEAVARNALVVDLRYDERVTDWVRAAREHGLEAVDGLGLLVHQARHSLVRWFGRDVPLAPLAAAVGWPR